MLAEGDAGPAVQEGVVERVQHRSGDRDAEDQHLGARSVARRRGHTHSVARSRTVVVVIP